jgi:tRNA(Ile)-lysidine synthase
VPLAATRPDLRSLDRNVAEVLDQRLLKGASRPLAVALSGGGDSVALLLAAAAWAKAARRRLLVLTVDHRLQPDSARWTEVCAARAAALGAEFRALAWTGVKPTTGLPAAARAARHRLLAQAARQAGARVILMGHTADDVLEARAMRAAGATTPEPREWAPSPAWPEGRGVFLLRPLLGLGRAAVRDWLGGQGETWIEDPANDDLRFARARARRAGVGETSSAPLPATTRALAAACYADAAGVLRIARADLRASARAEVAAFAGVACLCAAGTPRPPAAARVERLAADLTSDRALAATLAGARVEADAAEVRFLREPGEAKRGGLAPLVLEAGETAVWDGRFEITAGAPMTVRPLAGVGAKLPRDQRAALIGLPPRARAALPAAVEGERALCLTLVAEHCRPLALARLHAACGLVEREPD